VCSTSKVVSWLNQNKKFKKTKKSAQTDKTNKGKPFLKNPSPSRPG
jgi:hypothetical protein